MRARCFQLPKSGEAQELFLGTLTRCTTLQVRQRSRSFAYMEASSLRKQVPNRVTVQSFESQVPKPEVFPAGPQVWVEDRLKATRALSETEIEACIHPACVLRRG